MPDRQPFWLFIAHISYQVSYCSFLCFDIYKKKNMGHCTATQRENFKHFILNVYQSLTFQNESRSSTGFFFSIVKSENSILNRGSSFRMW